MIFLLIGENSFLLKKRAREIKEKYIKEGFVPFYFDFKESNLTEFQERISGRDLFQKKKIFFLENFPFTESFFSLLDKDKEDIFVLEKELKEKEREKIPPFFSRFKVKIEKFPLLSEGELEKWIEKELGKISIGEKETKILLDNFGQDLWSLENEIAKLSAFKNFQGKIQKEDLEEVIDFPEKIGVFEVVDNILSRRKKKSISSLEKLFLEGESPYAVFSLLAKYFSLLMIFSEAGKRRLGFQTLVSRMREHPYVLKKSYRFALFYSFSEIKKIYQRIFYLESLLKEGKISPQLALSFLALSN